MTPTPRTATATALRRLHADRLAMEDALAGLAVPAAIVDWLRDRALLKRLPLAALVPDPAMLPPEAIRFFRLDPAWTTAFIEGAASIARASSADAARDAVLVAKLHAASRIGAGGGPVTGFLLRSAVVTGWPGLEVSAYADRAEKLPLDAAVLRAEIVAPGILLYMVDGVLARLYIHEPPEGLHFGMDSVQPLSKAVRRVAAGAGGEPAGSVTGDRVPVGYLDGEVARRPRIAVLAGAFKAGLAMPGFSAAEFALQLVEGVQSYRFDLEPAA